VAAGCIYSADSLRKHLDNYSAVRFFVDRIHLRPLNFQESKPAWSYVNFVGMLADGEIVQCNSDAWLSHDTHKELYASYKSQRQCH